MALRAMGRGEAKAPKGKTGSTSEWVKWARGRKPPCAVHFL